MRRERTPPEPGSLHERLEWIFEHRSEDQHENRGGKESSQRGLSMRAGLSPSYLGSLLGRLRRGQDAAVGLDTADALARAAGVRLQWLANGEEPRDIEPAAVRRRELAAQLAREAGVLEDAVQAVLQLSIRPEDEQRTTLWWVDEMRSTALRLMRTATGELQRTPPGLPPPVPTATATPTPLPKRGKGPYKRSFTPPPATMPSSGLRLLHRADDEAGER